MAPTTRGRRSRARQTTEPVYRRRRKHEFTGPKRERVVQRDVAGVKRRMRQQFGEEEVQNESHQLNVAVSTFGAQASDMQSLKNDPTAKNVSPSLDRLESIRETVLAMQPGQTMRMQFFGWDLLSMAMLFESDATKSFFLHFSTVQLYKREQGKGRTRSETENIDHRYTYHSYYVVGDNLYLALEENELGDDYNLKHFTLDLPCMVYCQKKLTGGQSTYTSMKTAAAGFRDVYIPEWEDEYIHFPATLGVHCFLKCVMKALRTEFWERMMIGQMTAEEADAIELQVESYIRYKTTHYSQRHSLRSPVGTGISSKMIASMNKKFMQGFNGFAFCVYRWWLNKKGHKMVPRSDSNSNSNSNTHFAIHISKVFFDMSFYQRGKAYCDTGREEEDVQAQAHYVLLKQTGEGPWYDVAQALREHKEKNEQFENVSFEKLHYENEREVKIKREQDLLRETIPKRPPVEVERAETDTMVCVFDIESAFVPLSEDTKNNELFLAKLKALEEALRADGVPIDDFILEGKGILRHAPVMAAFGLVDLNRDMIARETQKVMPDEEVEHMKQGLIVETQVHEDITELILAMGAMAERMQMKRLYCYAHNASGYDNYLILKFLTFHPDIEVQHVLKTGRGLLDMKIIYKKETKLVFRCTKTYLGQSLKQLCKDLDVPKQYRKKKYDWKNDYVTFEKMKEESFRDNLKHYLLYDIYSLAFVIRGIEKMMQGVWAYTEEEYATTKYPLRMKSVTLPSFVRQLLTEKYYSRPYYANQLIMYDKLLLRAMRGGICQSVFRLFRSNLWEHVKAIEQDEGMSEEEKQLRYEILSECANETHSSALYFSTLTGLDCNSLYPTAMQTNALPRRPGLFVNTLEGCSDFLESTFGFEKGRDRWGVFKCRIDAVTSIQHINFGVMAYRTKEGLFYCNMKPSDVLKVKREICIPAELVNDLKNDIVYATSDDIWLWHVLGVEFTALEGVIWDVHLEPGDPYMTYDYSRFVTEMYTKRMENYHVNTLNRGYKLIMNTAYGSSAISMINGMHKIVNVDEDCHVQLSKEYFGTYKLADMVPLGCGKKALVHLKAKENCAFTDLSMKSTIGSRVLSASRRIMFESLFKACDAVGFGYHAALTNAVGYMDTDSFFVTKMLVKGFELAGLMGNALGQFKNDYEGPIVYMFAPLPKVRRMVILTKTGLKEIYKLKGLPLHREKEKLDANGEPVLNEKGKPVMEPEIDAKKMFETLEETFELTEEKEIWERNTRIGCQTYKTPYQIRAPSMMRNKKGVLMTRYSNCYLEKYFPCGRDVGLEDMQTHLEVGMMLFPNEVEVRHADMESVCKERLERYKRLRDQFDRPTGVSKRIALMEEHTFMQKVQEARFHRERLEMGYAM